MEACPRFIYDHPPPKGEQPYLSLTQAGAKADLGGGDVVIHCRPWMRLDAAVD